jgi:hypothetical protein
MKANKSFYLLFKTASSFILDADFYLNQVLAAKSFVPITISALTVASFIPSVCRLLGSYEVRRIHGARTNNYF